MALYRKRKSFSCSSNYCGEFPEYGAIFMSSSATKEECVKRKLFGLPLAFADFVKAVRPGMTLFLFEYESRKLFGVFEAVSDGQLDIVPHAFRSSSPKPFPAQVRVRVTWDCPPLQEDVFCGAISDNYYEKYKFNFGLSRQQVHRLLQLFDSQRLRLEKPLLKNEARKRHSRTSSDGKNLVMTSSGSYGRIGGHKDMTDEANTSTGSSKQVSMHVGVSPVLGDYIPLSSDIQVNVSAQVSVEAALYLDTSDQQRRINVFPRLNLHLLSAAAHDHEREDHHSDLLPRFVLQKEERTHEADHHPVLNNNNKILDDLEQRREKRKFASSRGQTKSSERASVFSRLTFT